MNIPAHVIEWLLEPSNPSIRYRSLTELLDRSKDDPDVIAAREQIPGWKIVKKILDLIHEDGDWPWTGGYDSPELGFNFLGEVGIDKSHALVQKAADVFLSRQNANGQFPNIYFKTKYGELRWDDQSCYIAMMLRGLVRMGFRDDSRVQKSITFLLTQARWDGGYLCTKSYVKPGTKTKSCIRGSKCVLMLFAELPELWETQQCQNLLTYFLERRVFYQRNNHAEFVKGLPRLIYPFYWEFDLLGVLLALSKMGYGNHPDVVEAWHFLDEKMNANGTFNLDWTMPKCSFKVGKKGEPNKWVTFNAYLAYHQRVVVPSIP
ncbi:MAG: hypothetical protein V2J07_02230 [Anaerolineae bacterium]|jgi:hypothetical protein|nr:hypothetical protein [Anaerolineae bacterium]